MVAAIVQSSPARSVQQRPKRSSSIDFENVKVTIKVPRVRRSLLPAISIKNFDLLTAEEKRRVEEANEAAIMAAVLAQIGNNHLDDDDDDEEDDEDDYEDDDEYDDEELESTTTKPKVGGPDVSNDGEDNEVKTSEKASKGLLDKTPSLDYAYDEDGGSDDYFLQEFKPRFSPGQFENPSINELIMLAASHRGKKAWQTGKLRH
ncbi:uncharacterized protein LOC129720403 [Wyeomyia smithii]|uniref:uncharacterized protein LOC129720403 n=1 Tax=Wyeomyia smithii TaxID=174621 RepID=UPI0024681CDF|nr:uncharacterized protein LOC129720403 [Wyeomyia smithii]